MKTSWQFRDTGRNRERSVWTGFSRPKNQALLLVCFVLTGAVALILPAAAVAQESYNLEEIVAKEWNSISSEELLYVYGQYFGNEQILKFRPGFCVLMTYYDVDKMQEQHIKERFLRFEAESNLREYGYSILPSRSDCGGGDLVYGIYGNLYDRNRFILDMENRIPGFVNMAAWVEFKKLPSCSTFIYAPNYGPEGTPSFIDTGVGRIDVREERYHGNLDACIDNPIFGTLGGTPEGDRPFISMGFSEELALKLSTTFIRVLYHPDMEFGVFRFSERKSAITRILTQVHSGRQTEQ